MTPTFPQNLQKFKTFIWIWTSFATISPFISFIFAIFFQLCSTPILPPMGHAHILRFSSDFEAFEHTRFSLFRSTDYNTFAIYLVKKISFKIGIQARALFLIFLAKNKQVLTRSQYFVHSLDQVNFNIFVGRFDYFFHQSFHL